VDDYYDESYQDEARDRTPAFVRLSPGAQAARDAIAECMALGWDDPDKPAKTGPTTGPVTACAMCGKPSGRLAPPWDFCHKCQQADLAD
jgi:hypothetical protein